MIDISKYVSKNKDKKILTYVYYKKEDWYGVAVATDTFRLGEVKIQNENIVKILKDGLYSPRSWKEITKILNKKNSGTLLDLDKIMDIVKREMAVQPECESYPDYKRIIPPENELVSFDTTLDVNADYFIDFVKDIGNNDDFNIIPWNKIKQNKQTIIYMDSVTTLLVMSMKR